MFEGDKVLELVPKWTNEAVSNKIQSIRFKGASMVGHSAGPGIARTEQGAHF